MQTICLHDKAQIADILQREVDLHLYQIGDLDPRQWPYTTWYALAEGERIAEIALLYSGFSLPVLLAFSSLPERMAMWLASFCHLLPRRCYAHLSPGVETALASMYQVESHGLHYKMALRDPDGLATIDTANVVRLSTKDIPALIRLYSDSYPGNFFEDSAFDVGPYFGIWDGTRLVAVAGMHIYSPTYGVAALGNIATHPAYRGKGLATRTCARLIRHLQDSVSCIGLNVKADNDSAIACYQRLGFTVATEYSECMLEACLAEADERRGISV